LQDVEEIKDVQVEVVGEQGEGGEQGQDGKEGEGGEQGQDGEEGQDGEQGEGGEEEMLVPAYVHATRMLTKKRTRKVSERISKLRRKVVDKQGIGMSDEKPMVVD